MKDKVLKIINHYGTRNQLKYFYTEFYELTESVLDFENCSIFKRFFKKKKLKNNIKTELADNLNFLLQIKEYYKISDEELKKELEYKIDRQIKRIEEEK